MNGYVRNALLALALYTGACWAEPVVRVVGLFPNAAVVIIDGQRQMLRAGQPGPQGIELVSADSNSATLRINGNLRQFGLQRDFGENFSEPERQRVSIPRGDGGHFRITGSINGQNVQFMLDTGATSVAMNANQARRLGVDYRVVGTPIQATTASGQVSGYRVRLDRVKVGEIELSNVDGVVLEGGFPTEVLLGMSWLSRVRMDDQGNTLVLERRF